LLSSTNSKIFNNTILLIIRIIVTTIFGIVSTRILIQNLGVSQFGVLGIMIGLSLVLSFLNTVMTSTTFRFVSYEIGKKENGNINSVINASFHIHLGFAIILVFLSETIGIFYIKNVINVNDFPIDDLVYVMRATVIGMVFSIIIIPYQGLINAYEDFKIQVFVEILKSFLIMLIAYFLLNLSGSKLKNYVFYYTLVSILCTLIYFVYSHIKFKKEVEFHFIKDKLLYFQLLSHNGWLLFGALGYVGQRQGSELLTNSFFGSSINATFNIANQVINLTSIFAKNLGQAAMPQIIKNLSGGNYEKSFDLNNYMTKYTFFLLLIFAVPLLIGIELLLKIWLVDIPPFSVIFCKLFIISSLIESVIGTSSILVQGSGKIKIFMLVNGLISLLGLPISFFLFNSDFPPFSIIIVNIFILIINNVIWLFMLKKLLKFDLMVFWNTVLSKVFLIIFLLIPFYYFVTFFQIDLFYFLFISLMSFFYILTLIYFFGLDEKEKVIIKRKFNMIINEI
jgi:O-antigen/teichoic acid export membrane protein